MFKFSGPRRVAARTAYFLWFPTSKFWRDSLIRSAVIKGERSFFFFVLNEQKCKGTVDNFIFVVFFIRPRHWCKISWSRKKKENTCKKIIIAGKKKKKTFNFNFPLSSSAEINFVIKHRFIVYTKSRINRRFILRLLLHKRKFAHWRKIYHIYYSCISRAVVNSNKYTNIPLSTF